MIIFLWLFRNDVMDINFFLKESISFWFINNQSLRSMRLELMVIVLLSDSRWVLIISVYSTNFNRCFEIVGRFIDALGFVSCVYFTVTILGELHFCVYWKLRFSWTPNLMIKASLFSSIILIFQICFILVHHYISGTVHLFIFKANLL